MKKVRKVVALGYAPEEGVPTVIYKAAGIEAENLLRENRRQYGVHIVNDRDLVEKLYRLPMQGSIGIELYGLVAQILAHVFEVEERMKRSGEK